MVVNLINANEHKIKYRNSKIIKSFRIEQSKLLKYSNNFPH